MGKKKKKKTTKDWGGGLFQVSLLMPAARMERHTPELWKELITSCCFQWGEVAGIQSRKHSWLPYCKFNISNKVFSVFVFNLFFFLFLDYQMSSLGLKPCAPPQKPFIIFPPPSATRAQGNIHERDPGLPSILLQSPVSPCSLEGAVHARM